MRIIPNQNNINMEIRIDKGNELVYILKLLKRRFWLIFILSVLTTFAGYYYYSNFHIPLYKSSTRVILNTNQDQIRTLQAIIRDPAILEKVIEDLNIKKTAEGLSNQISVENVGGSQVVNIIVVDSDPALAAQIANTTAAVFKSEIAKIIYFTGVTILSEAKETVYPINDNKNQIIIVSLFIGILGGIGIIFLLNSLDNTLKSEEEVHQILSLPVLGSVSKINKKNTKKKIKMKHQNITLRGESIGS